MKTRAWRKNFVLCTCLHPGCPRTRLLDRKYLEPYVPKATVEIRSDCPWHEMNGMKAYPEHYYDAQGRELDWETGKPLPKPRLVNDQGEPQPPTTGVADRKNV